MRYPFAVIALCTVAAWESLSSSGQQPAAPTSAQEIQQLRQSLLDQLQRLDALEAGGGAVDPAEIAAIKSLLGQTNQRISALEAQRASSAPKAPGGEAVAQGSPVPPPPAEPVQAAATALVQTQNPPSEKLSANPWAKPYMPTFYGILKPRFGVSATGNSEVGQSTSRLGLNLDYPFAQGFSVFARLEVGINLTKQNTVMVYPSHGPPQGQGQDPIYTRLGYGGVSTPWGSFSVGKVYSTYYDIAGWTDQFYTYGADASGAFGVADGGVAGTGRASTAVQYRLDKGWFHLGFQSQHRNSESNDAKWYDTVGGSLRFDAGPNWTLGAAYQEVRDGKPAPEGIESKLGDKAFIAGFRFKRGPWYVAADYSDTRQNQKDDQGVWFDAHGFELAVIYAISERWGLQWGYNYLKPRAPYTGLYQTNYGLFTVAFTPHKNITFSGEFRLDDSKNADGSRRFPKNVLALGLDFGW
jgi:predicted porin